MMLEASRLTMQHDKRVLLFFVNDHVRGREITFIRHIPMMRLGQPIRVLPSFHVPKKEANQPLRYISAPTDDRLNKTEKQVKGVLSYEASQSLSKYLRPEAMSQVSELFKWLRSHANKVQTFPAWVVRCLLSLLDDVWEKKLKILVVPSSALSAIFPSWIQMAIRERMMIAKIQNRYANIDGDWPENSNVKQVSTDYLPFNVLCPSCRDIMRSYPYGNDVLVSCHGKTSQLEVYDDRVTPKVVLRQPLANLLRLEYRVCGNKLGYWDVADDVSNEIFCIEPAIRYMVKGYVSFKGIGDLDPRPAMLRVLAEMSVRDITAQIFCGQKDDDLILYSPFVTRAQGRYPTFHSSKTGENVTIL